MRKIVEIMEKNQIIYTKIFLHERAYNELILSEMEKIKEEENECIVRNVEVK